MRRGRPPAAGPATATAEPSGRRSGRLSARRALVAEGALSRLSFGLVGFTMPLYAAHLGLGLPAIGSLVALNSAVALALKPAAGVAADRIGPRRTLLGAMVLRSVLSALYATAALPWQLFSVRCLHGVADSARDPSVAVLLAEAGGTGAVARSFAWYQTAKTSAGAAGKALAGLLITYTGARYGVVFGVAAVLSLLPVLVVARWVREPEPAGDERADAGPAHRACAVDGALRPADARHRGEPLEPPLTRRRLAPVMLLGLLVSATMSSLSSLFPLLATQYAGLTAAQAGALYLLTPVLAFAGPGFGWLSDRVSRRGVLAFRGAANVASSLVYLLVPTFPGFLTGKALDDLGKAAFKPAWGSVTAQIAAERPQQRARAMAWAGMGEDAGDVLAPVVAGLVWHWWGVVPLLLGRAVLSVVAEAQAWRVDRSLPAPRGGPRRTPTRPGRAQEREPRSNDTALRIARRPRRGSRASP